MPLFASLRVRPTLFGSATLHLLLRFLVGLSPRGQRRFAAPPSASLIEFYSPAAGMVSLGWLAACKKIFYLFACGGHCLFLQQAATNRVGRGLQPRSSSPSLVYGLKAAFALAIRPRNSTSTYALCGAEKAPYARFNYLPRVAWQVIKAGSFPKLDFDYSFANRAKN